MPDPAIDVRSIEFTGDSSTALGLDHHATVRRFSRTSFAEHPITRAPAKDAQLVVLPDPGNDCRADLVGKSPDEMAEIIARTEADRDENFDFKREMEQVPGGRAPGSHSSGRSAKKPHPRPSLTNVPISDIEAPAKYRPHTVSGKVSTEARHALYGQAVTTGEMFDLLGETLHAGISWYQIEFILRELQAQQRVA